MHRCFLFALTGWAAIACSSQGDGAAATDASAGVSAGIAAGMHPFAGNGGASAGTSDVPNGSDAAIDSGLPDAAVDAAVPMLPTLAFDPPGGSFTSASVLVTLVPKSADYGLYCTLDGSLPDRSSPSCDAPITIATTTLLRVAVYDGDALIALESASYVQLAPEVESFDSNLPLVLVHMLDGSKPLPISEQFVPAVMQVRDRDGRGRTSLLEAPVLDARVGIKVRGKSTRFQEKPSYSFEIRDQVDQDHEGALLLDLPPQSDYVLYAPYDLDRALIRNALFYALSNAIGRYAPRTRFVEVFIAVDGQSVTQASYEGVYVLIETIKRDRSRVDVRRLQPTDLFEPPLSGGYIARVDEPELGETVLAVQGIPDSVSVIYPNSEIIAAEQTAYIGDFLNAVGRAFAAPDHVDPMSLRSVDDLVDLDAMIDHHILNTLAKNPDAFRLSGYMHKDRESKLVLGPLWDCDRCMGSYDGRDEDPNGWDAGGDGTHVFEYGYYAGFFADAALEARYWARLEALLGGPFMPEAMTHRIEAMAAELDEAAVRNAARFPAAAPASGLLRNEIDHLENWLDQRVSFIRDNLGVR